MSTTAGLGGAGTGAADVAEGRGTRVSPVAPTQPGSESERESRARTLTTTAAEPLMTPPHRQIFGYVPCSVALLNCILVQLTVFHFLDPTRHIK